MKKTFIDCKVKDIFKKVNIMSEYFNFLFVIAVATAGVSVFNSQQTVEVKQMMQFLNE